MKTAKKTHWLRITLIVLIVCGLVGCVLAAVQFNQKSGGVVSASASVEFSFDGAAEGVAPDGEKFNLDSMLSDELLISVLEAEGLSCDADQFRPSLTVAGVYPENIVKQLMSYESLLDFSASRTLTLSEYHPTLYTVTLTNEFDRGYNGDRLKSLLSSVLEVWRTSFIREHSLTAGTVEIGYDLDSFDYPQQLTLITSLLQETAAYAEQMTEKEPALSVGGQSFSGITVRLNNLIDSDISRLNANIIMNALTRNTARLTTQYMFEIRDLENQLAKKTDQLAKMESLLAAYQKNEIIYLSTTENLTKIDGNSSETYDSLVSERKKVSDEITAINTSITTYQLRLNDLLKIDAEEDSSAKAETAAEAAPTAESGSESEGQDTVAAQAEQTAVMMVEEIAAAAQAAEEAAARQTAALEQSIQDLLDKRAAIMVDFSALLQAYNDQQINDLTVTVSPVKVYESKLLSGAFLKQALKTAGPFCAVGLMVCLVLVILSRRAEDRQKR